MHKKNNSTENISAAHLTALLTILIWGTTFVSTKILLNDFTPTEILIARFVLGFLALFLIYPHRLKVTDKKHEIVFACAGLCGMTLYQFLENMALSYSLASNVGVIVCIAPFFTAILAQVFLDSESLTPQFFVGFLIAISGIILVSFNGSATFELNPLGDLLAVVAAMVWAIYSILGRKISSYGYNTIQATRRTFFYAIIFMIPLTFFFPCDWEFARFADPVNLFNIAFLGLGASAFCFVTWNFSVKVLGAVKTSVYLYLNPVITVITAMIVLEEKVTIMAAAGTVLALTGLIVSESKFSWRKRSRDADSKTGEEVL